MSKVSRYLRKNPEVKALLLLALEYAGVSVQQRQRFVEQADADGDGIPDDQDDTPNGDAVNDAPKTARRRVTK